MFSTETIHAYLTVFSIALSLYIVTHVFLAMRRGGSIDVEASGARRLANATLLWVGILGAASFIVARYFSSGQGLAALYEQHGLVPVRGMISAFVTAILDLEWIPLGRQTLVGALMILSAVLVLMSVRDMIAIFRSFKGHHLSTLWSIATAELVCFLCVGPLILLAMGPFYAPLLTMLGGFILLVGFIHLTAAD